MTSFWEHTRREESGCLTWTARRDRDGYGRWCGRAAHRFAYEAAKGPIPKGREIDHLCRNRACVNPAHLEAVTRRENIMRSNNFAAVNARKTHCSQGHEFTAENTYRWGGYRFCRPCNLEAVKRRKKRLAAQ